MTESMNDILWFSGLACMVWSIAASIDEGRGQYLLPIMGICIMGAAWWLQP